MTLVGYRILYKYPGKHKRSYGLAPTNSAYSTDRFQILQHFLWLAGRLEATAL